MRKNDTITSYTEMSNLSWVPMSFLVFRGQGIKLTSYVAQKCREKNTLMPVIEKSLDDEGYEGAIVLQPKCNLYLDTPVACVDYSSLYPSSIISENLSHDNQSLKNLGAHTQKLLKIGFLKILDYMSLTQLIN